MFECIGSYSQERCSREYYSQIVITYYFYNVFKIYLVKKQRTCGRMRWKLEIINDLVLKLLLVILECKISTLLTFG